MKTPLILFPLLAIAALSACKEKETREVPPPGDPALIINGATVSPLCFLGRSDDEESPSYPTTGCDAGGFSANPENPSPLSSDYLSTEYYYADPATPDEKFPGFVGYRYLGDYRGMKAVLTIENGGGTGTFTALQLLRPEPDGTLRLVETLAGGDRCNGGITTAFVDNGTLVYDVNLTPFDFLMAGNFNPGNLQPYDDLDACAVCCYGSLRHVNGKADRVIFNGDAVRSTPADGDDGQTTQACFDTAFNQQVTSGRTDIPLKDLKEFLSDFFKTCAPR